MNNGWSGFDYNSGDRAGGAAYSFRSLYAPLWPLAILAGIPPVVWLWLASKRHTRQDRGFTPILPRHHPGCTEV